MIWLSAVVLISASPGPNLVPNGGFERGLDGWRNLWTRESDAGTVALDAKVRHTGRRAVRIDHRGQRDWSFQPDRQVSVVPGQILEFSAWLKVTGAGRAAISVVTYNAQREVRQWGFAARGTHGSGEWRHLQSRFIVPDGVTAIQPRLTGTGPATTWLDDVALVSKGDLKAMRPDNLPPTLSAGNGALSVTLHTADGTLTVVDKRAGTHWRQKPVASSLVVTGARADSERAIHVDLHDVPSALGIKTVIQLDAARPEFTWTLSAKGELPSPLRYPHPFVTEPGTVLVVPMNEGISYPVDDESIRPRRLIAYGGHGICMGFWAVTDGRHAQMAILETPDDASIRIDRVDGMLSVAPEWDAQKGRFGYSRRLRYVFLDAGGHVAVCKRYRAYAAKVGLLKTLAQKRQENPNVDRLIGAVNVWCWDRDALGIVRDMRAAGIERILWSRRQEPDVIRAMNRMGVLTSRYDIYQDLMNPESVTHLHGVHPDWTNAGWPKDLMLDEAGAWRRGWRVRGKDGQWYPCGVLCDRQAPAYARRRIPAELQTHPYRCRFIDTTTASPWRECYHPAHPQTRGESRHWKMELLRVVSEEARLVTGSETGHEAAVPVVHYFEGMMSLGPYRVPDAGRRMGVILDDVPERVAKFQVGRRYRLPLWELVYHDCVVAQWYWGDYNNKLPAIWLKRDLFNVLYATPPMFMFKRPFWQANRRRFLQSYERICPVVRDVGYAEMTDHRFLTPDRDVQQTAFANGVTVTVNFGATPFRLPDGTSLAPMAHDVRRP